MNSSNLNFIKEEIYKCSKCGLCQYVCPLYCASKNEMYLPRGRYNVLNNFFNNKKKLSRRFIKNLDICLNCDECKNFCPSSIDSSKLYTLLKSLYKYKYGIFPFYFFYFFNLYLHRIKSILKKDNLYKINVKRKRQNTKCDAKGTVVYFQGCINKYINPSDKNASLNIIGKLGYKIINVNSLCCGLPYLSDGDFKHFNLNSEKIIQSIPVGADYIVCSCESCFSTLQKVFENSPLLDKLITFDSLLKVNNYNIPVVQNAFYFKTLGCNNEYYIPDNINIINKKSSCSLMENYFLLKYKELSKSLINKAFYKKEELDGKIIITHSQLSNFGFKEGVKYINSDAQILSYSEYIEVFS